MLFHKFLGGTFKIFAHGFRHFLDKVEILIHKLFFYFSGIVCFCVNEVRWIGLLVYESNKPMVLCDLWSCDMSLKSKGNGPFLLNQKNIVFITSTSLWGHRLFIPPPGYYLGMLTFLPPPIF